MFYSNETTEISRHFYSNTTSSSSPMLKYDDDYNSKQNASSLSSPSASMGLPLQGLVTKSTLNIVFKVNSAVIIFFIGLLGSALNLLNSVVFAKQGLKDPVTITLFVLSVADFGSVVTLWFRSIFFILLFFPDAVPNLDPGYLSGIFTWPHAVLVRVSCLLTVFIAFERWVCITFPLQANRIITVPVAKVYNFVVTACLVSTFISLYYYSQVTLMFLPQENRSLFIIMLSREGLTYASRMSSVVTSVYLTTFGLLIVFTILIIVKLEKQTKWRQSVSASSSSSTSASASTSAAKTTSGSQNDQNQKPTKLDAISAKNQKVVKMVVAICLIFIFSTLPSVINTLVYIYVPGYVEFGRYYNLYQVNNQICFTLEVVNSTCNFFIYFHMSSNFSNTLRRLLGKEKTNSN